MNSRNSRRIQFRVESLEGRTVLNGSSITGDFATLVYDLGTLRSDLNAKTPPSASTLTRDLNRVRSDFADLLSDVPKGEFQGLVNQFRNEITVFNRDINTLISDYSHHKPASVLKADLKAVNADTAALISDAAKLSSTVADEESDESDCGDERNYDDGNHGDDRGDHNTGRGEGD